MIAGAFVAIIGTFLPWITFGNDSVNGYETYFIGDSFDPVEWSNPGAYVAATMVLVVIMATIVLAAGRSLATWLISLFAVGLAGLMTLGAFGAIASVMNGPFTSDGLDVGFGAGILVLGAVTATIGSIVVAAKRS